MSLKVTLHHITSVITYTISYKAELRNEMLTLWGWFQFADVRRK